VKISAVHPLLSSPGLTLPKKTTIEKKRDIENDEYGGIVYPVLRHAARLLSSQWLLVSAFQILSYIFSAAHMVSSLIQITKLTPQGRANVFPG
jgi:hypothetical protein